MSVQARGELWALAPLKMDLKINPVDMSNNPVNRMIREEQSNRELAAILLAIGVCGGFVLLIYLITRKPKTPKNLQCPWCGGFLAGTFEKCQKCGSPVAWVNGLPRKGD
jgi:hypothetical protein